MARNKLIYGLADGAVVVASSDEQGGTWAGAVETIKHAVIPVYVSTTGKASAGNRKLIEAGGLEFPAGAELDVRQLFQRPACGTSLFRGGVEEQNSFAPKEDLEPRCPERDVDSDSTVETRSEEVTNGRERTAAQKGKRRRSRKSKTAASLPLFS